MLNIQCSLEDRVLGFIENQINLTEKIEDKKELLRLYVEAFKAIVDINKDAHVSNNKTAVDHHKIDADYSNKTQENQIAQQKAYLYQANQIN